MLYFDTLIGTNENCTKKCMMFIQQQKALSHTYVALEMKIVPKSV